MEELQQSAEQEGYRFVLPARERKPPVAVVTGFMGLVFLSVSLGPIAGRLGQGGLPGLFSLVMALPFLAVGLALLVVALAALKSRTVLELTPEEARSIERVGPLRWTFRRPLRDLRAVAVAGFRPARGARRPEAASPALALRLDFDGAKPLWTALGYPREKLVELAGHVRRAAPELARVTLDPAAPLVEEPDAAPAALERARRGALEPLGESDIARRELPGGGFELEVPPAGIWRGSKGLVLVGVVFSLFGAGALAAAVSGGREALPVALFALVFGGIGVGLVLTSVNLGRRTALLRVRDGELTVERASPFGREARRFALAELDEVRVGPSGWKVNDVDVLELQLHARGRKRMGLLSQRRDEELDWIAAQLAGELERVPGA